MSLSGDEQPEDAPKPLRQRLLEATLELLQELEPADLVAAVGTREIARRAGGSPASVNYHFGSIQGLGEAVVAHVFNPRLAPIEGIESLIDQVKNAHFPLQAAYAMHGAEFDRLTQDPEFRLRMGLWALGGPMAAEAFRVYLRAIDDRLAVVLEQLLKSWRRELRPPLDMASFIAVKVGLVNGNALRQLVEPTADRRAHFQRATVALDMVLLRVSGDSHGTDDRLAEMNYYPLAARSSAADAPRGDATRSRILHAAAELFTTHGYQKTRLSRIATQADVSSSTLNRYYASKRDIATDLFRQQAGELVPPPAADDDAAQALHQYLTNLAAIVPPRSEYAGPYLAALLTTPAEFAGDRLLDHTRGLLERLRAANAPTGDEVPVKQDLSETTTLLLALTIRRALFHPADAPSAAAAYGLTICQLQDTGDSHHHPIRN